MARKPVDLEDQEQKRRKKSLNTGIIEAKG
jgi:hypothetical protein